MDPDTVGAGTPDVKQRARDEATAIARAIISLGGKATPAMIAEVVGLPKDTVYRRMMNNSGARCGPPIPILFACDRVAKTWGLTHAGRLLAGNA